MRGHCGCVLPRSQPNPPGPPPPDAFSPQVLLPNVEFESEWDWKVVRAALRHWVRWGRVDMEDALLYHSDQVGDLLYRQASGGVGPGVLGLTHVDMFCRSFPGARGVMSPKGFSEVCVLGYIAAA